MSAFQSEKQDQLEINREKGVYYTELTYAIGETGYENPKFVGQAIRKGSSRASWKPISSS